MAILRAEFWAKILDKHGFSSMFGLMFLVMFGYGAHWAGDNVFIPMRDAQIRLMERLGNTAEEQAGAIIEVKGLLSDANRTLQDIRSDQRTTAEGVTNLRNSLDRASRAIETFPGKGQ